MASLEPYPVIEVARSWTRKDEAMGTKSKFWVRPPEDTPRWLFKYPQPGTGQHWAEKIAAEIAACLGIPHAVVELATFEGERGSVSRSFSVGGRALLHGNEALSWTIPYDPKKRFGQSEHTLANIFRTIGSVFSSESGATAAKRRFAAYVVLDALVGNTDRHHENWGFSVRRTRTGYRGFLAPSFDHASSLGRELRDEKRERLLHDGRVGHYCEKGRGAIYWTDAGRHGPSPLSLLRSASAESPDLFVSSISAVAGRRDSIESPVQRVPDDWMSKTARRFAREMLRYNAAEIGKCLN